MMADQESNSTDAVMVIRGILFLIQTRSVTMVATSSRVSAYRNWSAFLLVTVM